MIKKYFALSIVAASLTLAGCSSDDDDDGGDMGGVDGETTAGTDDTGGDDSGLGGDDTGDTTGGGEEEVMDMSTMTGSSVLDLARGTDADGDGEIDADSGVADLSELTAALGNYPSLVNALDDENTAYTVFAPNNDAIPDDVQADDALENTLSYHVVPGQAFNTLAVEAGTEFPLTLTTVQGSTIEIIEVEGGGYAVVDSADNEVALGEPTLTESAAPSTVYIIDQVLTAPEAMAPGGEDGQDGADGEEDGEGSGDAGGPVGAAGSAFAAIESDPDLAGFESLVNSSNFVQSLQDSNNSNFITFAPTDASLDSSVTTAAAYIVSSVSTPTTEAPAAGTYNGTGDQALTFEVSGSGDDLTVNGLPATFLASGPGGAVVKYGE